MQRGLGGRNATKGIKWGWWKSVYKSIYLQGQLFISGLFAAESFVTADSFHLIASLAMPLRFWFGLFCNIVIKLIVLVKKGPRSFLY